MTLTKLLNNQSFLGLALPALTTLFGLQMLRVLLPSFLWYLGDSVGVPYVTLGLYAFAPFLAAFLAAVFRRILGARPSLFVAVGGIAFLRLAEQLSAIPFLDLAFAVIGTLLFTFFFPIYLAYERARGEAGTTLGLGFLLGMTLDTALQGAFGTLDLSWQPGLAASAIVLILVAAQLWLLLKTPQDAGEHSSADFMTDLPLAAVGPFVFLAAVVLQNTARAATLTGWAMPLALGLILLADVVGLAFARLRSSVLMVLVGAVVLVALMLPAEVSGGAAAAIFFAANVLAFPLIVFVLASLGARAERQGMWRAAVANGIGWLLFVILTFLYYIGYDIRTGIPNALLPPLAAALVGLAAVLASRRTPEPVALDWTPATAGLVLLLVPIALFVGWREPSAASGKGFPVRVMTYNLHNGFNTDGRLDLEALAQTIEQARPDIVGLQEVARGWYVDSSADSLTWLTQRLQMPYIFGPTADPVWGNAILSRYPIKEWGNVPLPPRTLLLKRGFLWARIDVGGGEELLFIATHYHQIAKDTEIRQQQSPEILKFWSQRPRTIFLGDLNATPDAREMGMLREAGLKDAFAAIGQGDGFTNDSVKPHQRIDYIWFSQDLSVQDLVIPRSTASDHLGVAVTVRVR